jgi:iron complex transport system substrate-binding protein
MADTKGTGGLSLPFEVVLKRHRKQIFDCPGDFSSLKQMSDSNPHYAQFDSFKNKKYIRMP